jgi:ribosome-associated translation inhibitor RaiA
MKTIITAQGFDLSEALRESVRREIGRFVQSVRRPVNLVAVHLVDDRAPTVGGRAKVCRVSVRYRDEGVVEGSDAEADFGDAVPEAFAKALRPSYPGRT